MTTEADVAAPVVFTAVAVPSNSAVHLAAVSLMGAQQLLDHHRAGHVGR